ncbi:MAG: helix-hairpin-helix domain-containing protein [Chloroherpetonaceae bacterium]|nr:helix-hairpin-helix domain-containing protein [Chloroherpetonaceae bacterium]
MKRSNKEHDRDLHESIAKAVLWVNALFIFFFPSQVVASPVLTDSIPSYLRADSSKLVVSDSLLGRQLIDRVLDLSAESADNNELLEQLNLLRLQKIDLNTASVLEFVAIPFLSPDEAKKIAEYRSRFGRFSSLDPLREILGGEKFFYLKDIFKVEEAKVESDPDLPAFLNDLRRGELMNRTRIEVISRAITEVPSRFGFDPMSQIVISTDSLTGIRDTTFRAAYSGSVPKIYNRIQIAISENFFLSGLGEKDSGEESLTDFRSATFQVKNLYNLRSLIIGDYNLRFGQGLVMTTGRPFFKSPEAILSSKQTSQTVRPYTSVAEYGFFRGAATQVRLSDFEVTGFYSKNQFSTSQSDTSFSSFDLDGFYRTESERLRRGNLEQTTFGGHLDFDKSFFSGYFHFGVSLIQTEFSKPLIPADELRNVGAFQGSLATSGSIDWDILWNNINFFGELAYSKEQNVFSTLGGILLNFGNSTRGVVIGRFFDQNYYSPFANAFAERGNDGRNERGVYLGLETSLSEKVKVRGYADYYYFPFISFTSILPASGIDLLLQSTYRPTKNIVLETLVQRKTTEEALTIEDERGLSFRSAVPILLERIRNDFIFQLTPEIRLRTRVELKNVTKGTEQSTNKLFGWLIAQDVGLDLLRRKLSVDMRVAVYQTDSFDAAIYAYENDLPLLATIFAHNGRGRRFFLNARYQIIREFEIAFRFANTYRDDITESGSGNDRILTNSPSTVSFGIRANF